MSKRSKYNSYQKNASRRRIPWEISFEDFSAMWQEPCRYCGNQIETIGVDRLDNLGPYSKENTVPCCSICNQMKFVHDPDFWVYHMSRVLDHLRKNPLQFTPHYVEDDDLELY